MQKAIINFRQNSIFIACSKVISHCLLLSAFCLLTSCAPDKSAPIKADAAWGYCPVCHMKVQASDEWASEIHFSDGTKLMFESPGDMLAFYTAPDKYKVTDAQKDRANITKILLKEYQTKDAIDGSQAKLVYKSKVEGPMGPDFLAFNRRADADAFVAANGGTVVGLRDVTPEMVRDLRKR
ncbi:MAG TPA: nitrous oxide reductase accessory protein NosL [Blastocatellia bacterium]|nr:nitrous oxide reductase accessory protein NosL [Blastocatellia bacterium]